MSSAYPINEPEKRSEMRPREVCRMDEVILYNVNNRVVPYLLPVARAFELEPLFICTKVKK